MRTTLRRPFSGLSTLRLASIASRCIIFAELKNPKALREEIADQRERVAAISQLAEEEKRDLSDDEQAEIDAILGTGSIGASNFKPGKLAALEAQLLRAEKLEKNQADLAASRASQQRSNDEQLAHDQHTGAAAAGMGTPAFRIPSNVRKPARLKAFAGETKHRDAYFAGQFYLATIFDNPVAKKFCADNNIPLIRAAQTGTTDAKGGFLTPAELASTIIDFRDLVGIARQFATIESMASDVKNVPKTNGEPEMFIIGERAAITESDATWANIQLIAQKAAALVRYSSEIGEDAIISMADNLTEKLGRAAARMEDKLVFFADGTSDHGNFTGVCTGIAAGAKHKLAATKTKYEDITNADFNKLVAMLAEYADDDAAWYCNKRLYTQAMSPIIDAAGGNSGLEIAVGSGRAERMFKGYPVRFCSAFPKTLAAQANAKVLVFGSLRQGVMIGDRAGFEVSQSDQRYFDTDEIAIRGRQRFALKAHDLGTSTDCGALAVLEMGAAS